MAMYQEPVHVRREGLMEVPHHDDHPAPSRHAQEALVEEEKPKKLKWWEKIIEKPRSKVD